MRTGSPAAIYVYGPWAAARILHRLARYGHPGVGAGAGPFREVCMTQGIRAVLWIVCLPTVVWTLATVSEFPAVMRGDGEWRGVARPRCGSW